MDEYPSDVIFPGESSYYSIIFSPSAINNNFVKKASVEIYSNDPAIPVFTYAVEGNIISNEVEKTIPDNLIPPATTKGSVSPYDSDYYYCSTKGLENVSVYEHEFNPACYLHDQCYEWGCATYNWGRHDCDSQFYNNMTSICGNLYPCLLSVFGECVARNPAYGYCLIEAGAYYKAVDAVADLCDASQSAANKVCGEDDPHKCCAYILCEYQTCFNYLNISGYTCDGSNQYSDCDPAPCKPNSCCADCFKACQCLSDSCK